MTLPYKSASVHLAPLKVRLAASPVLNKLILGETSRGSLAGQFWLERWLESVGWTYCRAAVSALLRAAARLGPMSAQVRKLVFLVF